jgi:CSLREA domain-containing protein
MKKSTRGLARWMLLMILVPAFWFCLPAARRLVEVPALAAPMTFVVNSNDDSDDGVCNAAHCSLREAIKAANANSGADTINFNIPGGGVHRISPVTPLPDITDEVTINGYSQPGASPNSLSLAENAVLLIELSGEAIPASGTDGLTLTNGSGGSEVKGLVINGFKGDAIQLGSSNVVIAGNFIGTNTSGTSAIGNLEGLFIQPNTSNNVIGGSTPAARNLISGNASGGMQLSATSGNKVQGNFIGTAADGTSPLGNAGTGVFLSTASSDNIIGGVTFTTGERNVIAFNGEWGVLHNTSGTGNAVRFNSIHDNGRLGINISGGTEDPSRVSANDPGDDDIGPNNLQNFPLLTFQTASGGNLNLTVSLNSKPNTSYHVEIFSNPSCDPSGFGEGKTFNGPTSVTTNASGNGSTTAQIPIGLFPGSYLTATATDPDGNTSEFSPCVAAVATTFTVNSIADTNDGACTVIANGCTLREAITAANVSAGLNLIKFDLPGSGVRTIKVLSALPALAAPVVIDGYSQLGASANPGTFNSVATILVELNGTVAGNTDGLVLSGGGITVRGLAINRFEGLALKLQTKGDNVISGNFLGTDAEGATALPNGGGVSIISGSDNRIGGITPGDLNVISGNGAGNSGDGVLVSGDQTKGTLVLGNHIGVGALGFQPLGNAQFGINLIGAPGTTIGGRLEGAGNTISANGNTGLRISSSSGNKVLGNFIGTSPGGLEALGNGNQGVRLDNANDNIIGGSFIGEPNVIAANIDVGIRLEESNNNRIQGNFIGTNSLGFSGLGNTDAGIFVHSGTGNRVTNNAIANNGGLGINLNGGFLPNDGVTPNDPGDPDTGPNNLQNFPVLTSAVRTTDDLVDVQGTLNSTPNTTFSIEYFASSSCDPSLNGEGGRSLGILDFTTDGGGNAVIATTVSAGFISDQFLTTTAIDPAGNTSEFSRCVPISAMAPSPTPTPAPTPAVLQFGQAVYSLTEDCTGAVISVSRTGDTSQAVSVDYSTQPGTASDRSDFDTASGTLNFAPGVTALSFDVLISEDSLTEGTETATLVLSNPSSGAALGSQSSATLEILDDPSESVSNTIDVAELFVCQHYHDFLNREGDTAGENFWTNEIESCGSNAQCRETKRINVSAAFFLSIEFQETGFYVVRAQRAAFGKKSDTSSSRITYSQFLRDAQQVNEGVSVGFPGWEQMLEQRKQFYAEQIVTSAQFVALYSPGLTSTQYVDALFASAGVVPSDAERQSAIAAFGAGGSSGRIAAFRSVADSNSLRVAELRPAFVLMQYFGYLRRNPTDAPDGNDTGYQFWLQKLNQFDGDFQKADMVKAFISSVEYRQRFGQP